ncbi:MAG: PEP/pyruvate-binding domain-containing protein, partial [Acidimicrobiia bacterium]
MTAGIVWFDEITKDDVATAGGKGANLGELVRGGLPVPAGFVVTAQAYLEAMERADVRVDLRERVAAAEQQSLTASSAELQELVRKAGMPDALRDVVLDAYRRLGADEFVAVRSSATAEDSATTSFAGMNETFTNVRGEDELLQRIVDCWASIFSARVCAYRSTQGIDAEPAIAVVVQRMVDSERSGVMFTADPATGDRSRVVIEAAYGLGEVVVGGQVEPDTYVVAKDGPALVETRVGTKRFKVVRGPDGHDQRVDNDPATASRAVLEGAEILDLARLGIRVEQHYGEPQDTEWAIERGQIFLVQSRPITTLGPDRVVAPEGRVDRLGPALVTGLAAAPGVVVGSVRVLRAPSEGEGLEAGEILVAPMTSPDWVPVIRRAGALVTDSGGMTCHAAIVSRELGVPCVVGTRRATEVLRDGMVVTVDAAHGAIYSGDRVAQLSAAGGLTVAGARERERAAAEFVPEPLGTLVYVNLAIADQAERVASLPVDGVGLLRAEFMITEALGGVHPRRLLAEGRERELVDQMVASLRRITGAFAPRPVVYRTIDFR